VAILLSKCCPKKKPILDKSDINDNRKDISRFVEDGCCGNDSIEMRKSGTSGQIYFFKAA
jgi:hypothetical protein